MCTKSTSAHVDTTACPVLTSHIRSYDCDHVYTCTRGRALVHASLCVDVSVPSQLESMSENRVPLATLLNVNDIFWD